MLRICAPSGVHLPHGRQPGPDLALTLVVHLVRSRTERRHHLLMRTHAEMPLPTLLAEATQLDGFRLRLGQTLERRRFRCYGSQHRLEYVKLSSILLQARQHLSG